MKNIAFRIVNVFVENDRATFGGNPLAVIEDATGLDDATMQSIATQFNLSETTFIFPSTDLRAETALRAEAAAPPRIRIFTPRYELPFAGHPTVGTSFVVAAMREAANPSLKVNALTLELNVGPIDVTLDDSAWTFTANPHTSRAIDASRVVLAQAIGLSESDLGSEARFVSTGTEQLVIPVASVDVLARVKPNSDLLQAHFKNDAGRYMAYVVARTAKDRFQVRFFFPTASGMSEDPGTGSACSNLGGYLLDAGEEIPTQITVTQGEFINRLNVLQLSLTRERRVRVGGRVVEIGRGELKL
ncbi:MAG: PhzF family phenazine biosynthesis protein [Casimicrobium sp.]